MVIGYLRGMDGHVRGLTAILDEWMTKSEGWIAI
jgi:hypothetical protein